MDVLFGHTTRVDRLSEFHHVVEMLDVPLLRLRVSVRVRVGECHSECRMG